MCLGSNEKYLRQKNDIAHDRAVGRTQNQKGELHGDSRAGRQDRFAIASLDHSNRVRMAVMYPFTIEALHSDRHSTQLDTLLGSKRLDSP